MPPFPAFGPFPHHVALVIIANILYIPQIRILLIYVYGWHNQYYDQVVLVLTSVDPLINHLVCLWVMRKYRDGYTNALLQMFKCLIPKEDSVVMTAFTRISSFSRRSSRSFRKTSTGRPNRRKFRLPLSKPLCGYRKLSYRGYLRNLSTCEIQA